MTKKTGAKKVTPAERKKLNLEDPAMQELNKQILDELLPLVAAKIDGNGGVMKVADINDMRDVLEVIKKIPVGYPTKLSEILTPWTDFFVPMANGLVGTAMGYETGMIRENGTLDPAFSSTFTTIEEVGPTPGSLQAKMQSKSEPITMTDLEKAQLELRMTTPIEPGNEKVELNAAAHDLWQASLDPEDEHTLFLAFRRVEQLRCAIKGQPINPNNIPGIGPSKKTIKLLEQEKTDAANSCVLNLSNEDREARRMAILQRVLDQLRRAPDHTLLLNVIMLDRQIRDLKKGAVSKMLHFLEDFKSAFQITEVKGTPKILIRLLDPNASAQTIMNSLPASKRAKV